MAEQRSAIGSEALAACAAGDREAQRALFEALAPRVHALALHFFGGDRDAAMDVTQHVFVKLLSGFAPFRGEAEVSTWLHRVAVNACLDHRRARRPQVPLELVAETAEARGEAADAAVLRTERERAVRAAVAALPPRLRAAALLRHFEGASYDEIASALGCSPGTVASRLARGNARLAEALRAHGGDGEPRKGAER